MPRFFERFFDDAHAATLRRVAPSIFADAYAIYAGFLSDTKNIRDTSYST